MKVIAAKQLPMRCPLIATLVLWMALDHWSAPGWAYGAVGLVLAIGWILWVIHLSTAESAEVDFKTPR